MDILPKAQLNIFKKKGMSIQTIESTEPTPKKHISPKHSQHFLDSSQSSQSMIMNINKEKQRRIKQLLEENLKLLEQCSEQDLQIGRLYTKIDKNVVLRTQRVQTLNNMYSIENKKYFFNNQKPQNISDLRQKEDKQLFTFYSPEPKQNSQVFKLPKVFKAIPKQNKFFI
ncbi:unnamed protein product [Paramecium pentaurelia]|uniref:Uncharacterized protein n=1 Tax=Paramecium pentaurelia TaxID=43138 RepID=A0A8S1W0G0_9CILI|nr:unnamed protein product [Paramecium pentaurelia]